MLKSLRFLDFVREFILFSVVFAVFMIGSSGSQITMIWIITILSIVAWVCSVPNHKNKIVRYTKVKTQFEIYTLILLSAVFVYFGHWIIGSFILFSNFLFICSCEPDKDD
jgi:hypothetical protein|nr:MAG TPA: hypothetical protein [Caudoviricetes sp.]